MAEAKKKEPRFSFALDAETRRVLDMYCDVTGESRASVIRGVMRAVSPALMKAAIVIEKGRELEGTAKEGLVEAMDELLTKLHDAEADADDLLRSV